MVHVKLYVLADRFNITILRELSYSRCTALLVSLGNVQSPTDLQAILDALRYAFENLPSRNIFDMPQAATDSAETDGTQKHNLLLYFGRYAAWILVALRGQKGFGRLIEDNVEFAKAVVSQTSAAVGAPWVVRSVDTSRWNIHGQYCQNCRGYTVEAVTLCGNCGYQEQI